MEVHGRLINKRNFRAPIFVQLNLLNNALKNNETLWRFREEKKSPELAKKDTVEKSRRIKMHTNKARNKRIKQDKNVFSFSLNFYLGPLQHSRLLKHNIQKMKEIT